MGHDDLVSSWASEDGVHRCVDSGGEIGLGFGTGEAFVVRDPIADRRGRDESLVEPAPWAPFRYIGLFPQSWVEHGDRAESYRDNVGSALSAPQVGGNHLGAKARADDQGSGQSLRRDSAPARLSRSHATPRTTPSTWCVASGWVTT
jgi:hypothetical protein